MPRVSEEYREARRDEIARAALRVLERKGVRDTSIADIVAESGLSTGAIYSHFTNKAELARYVVGRFLLPRLDTLEIAGARGDMVSPRDALLGMLSTFRDTGLPPALVIQFWGEAMVDAELHAEMLRTAGRLLDSLTIAITPWTGAQGTAAADVAGQASRCARTIAALAQGYVANAAVFGPRDIDEYVASAAAALAS
ncbi:TetR/AcrR family transcriptional regulator [Microbacterium cremeum]|uniref:TetR/AcrR family transcriptional regulator n=1 Tax=Microbacterium cremeum TaxID=2782169 RepID=UPI0018879DA8|nr:TetR family transcriptional regulator [Microbacterium cremeum]